MRRLHFLGPVLLHRRDGRLRAAGPQFQVNSYTTGNQQLPSVAVDANGDFVVVWQSYGSSGSDTRIWSVQGQRYGANGLAAIDRAGLGG